MRRKLIPALSLAYLLAIAPRARADFALDFGSNPALPSASGLAYVTSGPPESAVASISGGILTLDTVQFSGDPYAFYQDNAGYDHTKDAQFNIDIRVDRTSNGFGLVIGFSDSHNSDYLVINPANWFLYPNGAGTPASGTFADPSAFHKISLTAFAATNTYVIAIDGLTVATGTNYQGYAGPSQMYFGDGTPTGGNVRAEIRSVSYFNPPRAVPEPAGIALLGIGSLALIGHAARRKFAKDTA